MIIYTLVSYNSFFLFGTQVKNLNTEYIHDWKINLDLINNTFGGNM